jgi:hypothetical protein
MVMDIQQFVDTAPQRIRRRWVAADIQQYKFPYKTEVALRAHAEHDALHYLFQQPFTKEGEEHVAYLEQKFHCGWLPLGEKYNPNSPVPCDCGIITSELIDETVKIIYEFYDTDS